MLATSTASPGGEPTQDEAEAAVRTLLRWIGEDSGREGLVDTPARVCKAYGELFSGYGLDPTAELSRTFQEVAGYDGQVVIRDIPFHSHQAANLLPIVGKVNFGYMPAGRVIGLSKVARVVDIFARRLQTPDQLASDIGAAIQSTLEPRGVAVFVRAKPLIALIGDEKTELFSSYYSGAYMSDLGERRKFVAMVGWDRAGEPPASD